MIRLIAFATLFALSTLAVHAQTKPQAAEVPDVNELTKMISRLAPTPLNADTSKLSPGDRKALEKLLEAAKIYNPLYMRQVWSGNLATYERLKKDTSPLGKTRLRYFWINKGPWSDLDAHRAFIPGVPEHKPAGANFYPEDMTKEEFEKWVATLDDKKKEQATGFFSVIRRGADGKLSIVPFSQEYKTELTRCAQLLREAATLTTNASLKKFLMLRADAFLNDDYYASDVAWMELDAPIEPTIGPYETYTDELFGYKAAFEAYIALRDDEETNKIAAFSRNLQQLENNLPIEEQYRNPKLGAAAPIRVVNLVFSSGDGEKGVQTAAFNLPNDERVIREKGSKRVMLKNTQEVKFEKVLTPIASRALAKAAQADVNFEMFFTHILAHELMHGLGPHQIKVGDRATTPRKELKNVYSAIEEAKADATGLWAMQYMMDNAKAMGLDGVVSTGEAAERQLYTTFLASAFRTLRFGINEAHGRGMALQVNYLLDKGAFVAQPDGTFSVDYAKVKAAVRDLTRDLLMLEARGDYEGAQKMLAELAVIRPEVKKALDGLTDIPIDIAPEFKTK